MKQYNLNSYFCDANDMDRVIAWYNEKPFTKAKFTALLKKYVYKAKQIKAAECVLYTQNNLLFMVGFFALLHAGKAVVLPSNIRKTTLEQIGALAVFTDTDQDCESIETFRLNFDAEPVDMPIEPIADTTSIVYFSSGSTGIPKRIPQPFSMVNYELPELYNFLQNHLTDDTVMIATVSFSHMYGMFYAFLLPIFLGLSLDTELLVTTDDLKRKLALYPHCFFVSSPAFLERLAKYKDNYSFEIKPVGMTSCGGLLSQEAAEASYELFGVPIFDIFGSTETGGVGFRIRPEQTYWNFQRVVNAVTDDDGRLIVTSPYVQNQPYTMQDAARLIEGRRFEVLGRLDRMLKIEEQRVSLPEVEQALAGSPLVEKVHCIAVSGQHRKSVGACVILNADGKKALISDGKKHLVNGLKDYLKNYLDHIAIPAKWRFIDEIPTNLQGKIIKAEIERLFSQNLAEPVLTAKQIGSESFTLSMVFLPDSEYFKGHFPAAPILPAFMQIHFVMYFAAKYWPHVVSSMDAYFETISRLKFTNILAPGVNVSLEVTKADKTLKFKYFNDKAVFSSGVLNLGDAPDV